MRILTVRQPWATLICLGHKPVENRVWGTLYRGDVAILAAQKNDTSPRARDLYERHVGSGLRLNRLPHGSIIGVAELYDVIRDDDPRSYSEWYTGPVGLLMRNARMLKHGIPCRGSLVLEKCCDEMAQRIADELTKSAIQNVVEAAGYDVQGVELL